MEQQEQPRYIDISYELLYWYNQAMKAFINTFSITDFIKNAIALHFNHFDRIEIESLTIKEQ